MPTRLTIAKKDIVQVFEAASSRVFRQKDIAQVLSDNRAFWRLTQSISLAEFIKYLLEHTQMRRVKLKFPYRPETLYLWGDVSDYMVAVSAKPGAYLCHFTAMHIHGLTDQEPETIYANQEQRPQNPPLSPPTQHSVDAAFRRPQRITTNIADLNGKRLCVVNGKNTGQLGVVEVDDASGQKVKVTGLERTLIDITVRPSYAGGVSEVLEAYRRAADRISVNKLAAMLKKMDFMYPYQQAIGFYMDHSGAYEAPRLELLKQAPFDLDFYLTYAMTAKEYSPAWRIFYPAGL